LNEAKPSSILEREREREREEKKPKTNKHKKTLKKTPPQQHTKKKSNSENQISTMFVLHITQQHFS
jgi:hypothetical protein